MASAPGEAPPIDSQPPPDILPPDPPLPPVVDPPIVSPPAPDAVPPTVTPPPAPDAVPPTVTPPPAPDAVPPTVTPPPAPDAVPPTVTPPPVPDAVPPTVSPPPVPDVVPPPVTPPPAPDVVPPPVTPPPAPDVVPPVVSPPAPDAVPPPVISPPAPDAVPPPVISPPAPDVVPPPVTPPPAPDVVPPVISPPAPDVVPPPMSPPLVPDVVPPPSSDSPPSPNVLSPPPPVNSSPGIPSPSTSHSPPPSINPKSPPSSKSTTTPVIVGAALGSVALLLAVFGLFWFVCVRKKKNRRRNPHEIESYYKPADGHNGNSAQSGHPSSGQQFSSSNVAPSPLAPSQSMSSSTGFSSGQPQQSSANGNSYGATEGSFLSSGTGMVLGSGTIAFTYDELKIATNGFSSVNLLGQGGFGYVHKGMLQNGKIVAVKSLKADSGQGEREFQAEVETISRVHHKHLVTLVGYCVTDKEKLLVYEFVQNKTMEFHLHGKGQPVMDWQTRLKIAVGSAKGLAYLHEDCHPKIIHRDIKAANILLDHSFEAQVADFGLAKFTSDANTHVSTRVMGTFGYLAPEYASSGQLSDKSDVFSFGVLLLELITGRRPVDFTSGAQMDDSLVDWARPILAKALQDGSIDSLVDPRLEKNYNPAEMGAMITCAASCVRHSAKRRPRLSEVVRALEGNMKLSDLNDGVEPGFSSLYSSTDLYAAPNTEDMSRFRRMAHGPDDEESSDFSATRNEFTGGR